MAQHLVPDPGPGHDLDHTTPFVDVLDELPGGRGLRFGHLDQPASSRVASSSVAPFPSSIRAWMAWRGRFQPSAPV